MVWGRFIKEVTSVREPEDVGVRFSRDIEPLKDIH